MKRTLMVFAILVMFVIAAGSAMGQARHGNKGNQMRRSAPWVLGTSNTGRHKGTWRKKDAHGYKNYGQYRRTQVGNRRSKLVRRYYWDNGTRLSRLVRVFY